jgi:hypothetical protein
MVRVNEIARGAQRCAIAKSLNTDVQEERIGFHTQQRDPKISILFEYLYDFSDFRHALHPRGHSSRE